MQPFGFQNFFLHFFKRGGVDMALMAAADRFSLQFPHFQMWLFSNIILLLGKWQEMVYIPQTIIIFAFIRLLIIINSDV